MKRNTQFGLLACLMIGLTLGLPGAGRAAGPFNATPVNSPAYVTDSGFGQAASLDGSTQYFSLPSPGPLTLTASQSYTVEARVKTTDAAGTKIILGQLSADYSTGWYLGLVSGAPSLAPIGDSSAVGLTSSSSIADGNWHTVAAAVQLGTPAGSPSTETLYVDGVRVATGTFNEKATVPGAASIGRFGQITDQFQYNGQVDEVRISNVARYSGAFYTLPTAPFTADTSTVALYHLDGNGTDSGVVTTPANVRPVWEIGYCSPNNTYSDGTGAIQPNNVKTGATFFTWDTPGAYLKTGFSGTSCAINLDLSALVNAGTPAGYYPTVRWSVDNGAYSPIYTLAASDSVLAMSSGLAAGNHTLRFEYVGAAGGTSTNPDRYLTPVQAITSTGITLDAGASLSSVPILPRVVLTTADSLGEGVRVNGATGLSTDQDAFGAVGWQIAQAMGAEWSNRSIGGGGWTVGGSGNTPPYFTPGNDTNSWWNKYSAGRPLLVSGKLAVQPYVWLNFYGTNDGLQNATDSAVTASVSGWLPSARAAAPSSYIVVGIPPGQFKKAAILGGFTAYQGTVTINTLADGAAIYSGANDPKAFVIDEGLAFSLGVTQFGTPTLQASDGLHPLLATNAVYGARLTSHIQQAITPSAVLPKRKTQ